MKALVIFIVSCFISAIAQPQTRPNVVFIMADDLGYGDIGCYGQKLIATPHIDKLALGGIKFTNFYAGTSVCAPSRSAFMTGQHTGHTAIRGNRQAESEGQWPIPAAAFTIAELFKNTGYATSAFGKWGLGFVGTSGDPVKQGFDQFYGYNSQSLAHNYFPNHLWDNDQKINLDNTFSSQQQYAPDLIQKQALAFIETHKAEPFFLFLPYTLPHAALQLPVGDPILEKYKKQFNEEAKPVDTAWNGKGYQPQSHPRAAFAAMVTKLDSYVGEIMQKLESLGIEKNTLVIFTSDNGPHKEGGHEPEFFNSSGNFRGIKRDLYEGGIRVPMIAYWPAQIKKAKQSHFVGASWDFLPTFADLLHQPIPQDIDGVSLLPTLISKGKQQQHPFLYWEFHEQGGRQAVRMGKWKGVRQNVATEADSPMELYDLEKDPNETTDLAATNQEIVHKIKTIMQQEHVENEHFLLIKK